MALLKTSIPYDEFMEFGKISNNRIDSLEGIALLDIENQWMPTHCMTKDDSSFIVWKPFYSGLEQTLDDPRWFLTTLPRVFTYNLKRPGLPLQGFVHHMSRCGSTLVCRLLDCLTGGVALCEPSLVNSVLWANRDEQKRIELLKICIPAMIRPEHRREFGFIKTTSSCILSHKLLYEAFPETPSMFVYRHPLEVLVSLYRAPSGPLWGKLREAGFEGERDEVPVAFFVQTATALIRDLLLAGFEAKKNGTLLVDYPEILPRMFSGEIPQFFGCTLDEASIKRMQHVAKYNSNYTRKQFDSDVSDKRTEAESIPFLVEEARKEAIPLYEAIKSKKQY